MKASIRAIEYHLPSGELANEHLARQFPEWSVEKIAEKTGIVSRRIAGPDEWGSDLAAEAAQKLFQSGACAPKDVDFVIFCTQSPDYLLPTTACLLQHRLRLRTDAGALDVNLGCSGYVYCLSLAKGLIETGQAQNVLLLTADTYTKFLDPQDKGVRTIFGDGASATLVAGSEGSDGDPLLGPFVFGTDGSGGANLIVAGSGMRGRAAAERTEGSRGAPSCREGFLHMNGPEIFTFTLRVVPRMVQQLLAKAGRKQEEVDLFVFHQANQYLLDHLRAKLSIPPEKFCLALRDSGNTVSTTIPLALKEAQAAGTLRSDSRVMLVGFGVGYSWSAALARWPS
jgi:3-oxoacyl-[acyl-carrier-protein] synthase-3